MAEKVTATDGGSPDNEPGTEHNSAARNNIIKECADDFKDIRVQRAALNEKAGKVRKRLKDAGIDVKAVETAVRLSEMEDQEARDSHIDGLKEAFGALGLHGQLDWVSAQPQGHA